MFAFKNIHLYSTLHLVNVENKNIYTQLQSSSSNAEKYTFKFKLIQLIFIKFGYNLRCHWLKERLLPEYKARRGTVSCHAICQFVQGPTTSPTSF